MKIKNLNRIMAAVCAICMTASMTACSPKDPEKNVSSKTGENKTSSQDAKDTKADPLGKYETPIKLTTVIGINDEMQQMIDVKADVQTNNNWYNGYKEELGIEVINEWSVPGTQYEQKLNQQISANDLPDFFRVSAQQLKTLTDNGMVADLTDVFAEYASEFTNQMMADDNNISISQSSVNGKIMALPNVGGNISGTTLMWLRRDWLKAVGKEVPKTIKELEELALAFVNEDPDGNGKKDTYGIALNNTLRLTDLSDMTGIAEGFGGYIKGWVEKDGKVENGQIQPEVKNALTEMAKWYKAGIFDKEFVAKDGGKVTEDLVGGRIGIAFGQHWNAFSPYPDAVALNPDADWAVFPIPTATDSPAKPMIGGSAGEFHAVNVDCKNPEAIVKLYNYHYKKDCALSPDYDSAFHATGSTQIEKPEQAFQWSAVRSFYPLQNLFIHRGVKKYNAGDKSVLENAWVADNALACEKYTTDPVANKGLWGTYMWSSEEGAYSVIDYYETNKLTEQNAYILASTDGMTKYTVTLDQLVLETYTKIITGALEPSAFDDFVSKWKSLGGDEITAEINEALGK